MAWPDENGRMGEEGAGCHGKKKRREKENLVEGEEGAIVSGKRKLGRFLFHR